MASTRRQKLGSVCPPLAHRADDQAFDLSEIVPLNGAEHEDVSDGSVSGEVSNTHGPLSRAEPGVDSTDDVAPLWTTSTLTVAYAAIWLVYLVESMLMGTMASLAPFITSDFSSHSLTPTVGILSSIIGGVANLTLAKVLDIFGRPMGFVYCIILAILGLLLMTVCNGIEVYAVAQVFQSIGNNGILYSLAVFVADTSSLQNRGLIQAVVSSPNLVACLAAGPLASWFLGGPGWRSAFGMFAVLVLIVTSPLFGLILVKTRQAERSGLASKPERDSDKTRLGVLTYYCQRFDMIGLGLLSSGVALILLPFNLYAQADWNHSVLAIMLVIGVVLIIGLVFWERNYATLTFMPYTVLLDRTVIGACILSATLFFSFWCWNSFFSSYLQVVNGLSVAQSSYVVQTYTVCSVLCGIAVGALIRQTGRFKPVCLYVGMPLSIIGTGCMSLLSSLQAGSAPIVVCQIALSVAAGVIMVCDEIAMLAAAPQQHTAVCLAVLGLFGNIGAAVGLTVASAIWQSVFPATLRESLPSEALPDLEKIYANLSTQLSYPMGSEVRIGIQNAYAVSQMRMLLVGSVAWIVGSVGVLMWRNINVIEVKQKKAGYR
ncbi:major facilitator superfamily domain-containing protein [Emericellopsis atlantica]|uniref:Major facilitator superfamily domain-containing protein n=1 Tax=Emericellopsis atlantica TaxID=2614577 RepID=A0A9P7ZM49_9HYPO|nr:major facilitator superfamily domain-containing protein [Emericellopsis atlantica]KAG9254545.1 major facilitator superfamily domain-containing protein [Emericellopsis atlantica]